MLRRTRYKFPAELLQHCPVVFKKCIKQSNSIEERIVDDRDSEFINRLITFT